MLGKGPVAKVGFILPVLRDQLSHDLTALPLQCGFPSLRHMSACPPPSPRTLLAVLGEEVGVYHKVSITTGPSRLCGPRDTRFLWELNARRKEKDGVVVLKYWPKNEDLGSSLQHSCKVWVQHALKAIIVLGREQRLTGQPV